MNIQTSWKKFAVFTKINKKLTKYSYYVHNCMIQFVICKERTKNMLVTTDKIGNFLKTERKSAYVKQIVSGSRPPDA